MQEMVIWVQVNKVGHLLKLVLSSTPKCKNDNMYDERHGHPYLRQVTSCE